MVCQPLISVIITAFNRADTIGRAVQGVSAQTFQDYEIVIVDDASTDDTSAVVQAMTDPRIRLVRNATNRGIGGAKNVGVEAAQGRYIAFLDSDDDWVPEKLATQLTALNESPGVPLCFSAFWVHRQDCEKVVLRQPRRYGTWRQSILLGETFSLGSTLFAARDLFSVIGGFNEGLPRMQDRDWTLRYLDHFDEFLVIDRPLAGIYNSGWPKSETVEYSTGALFDANQERLSRWGGGADRLFRASLNFEVAVAYYRNGNRAYGITKALRIALGEPQLTGHLAQRLWRKVRQGDFG